jgi:hypothetical protein
MHSSPACRLSAAVNESTSWEFSVLLDGSQIGYHRFKVVPAADGHEVFSEASFDVRFLFITAFRYRHKNTESWRDGCLERIESQTRENDKRFSVSGERVSEGFYIESGGGQQALDSCVMTFAYWNPEFLQQARLLNPQSGEYLPVTVEPLGKQSLEVRGELVSASAYRLTARATELTVWYSDDKEWLGLESAAKGGRTIRYELT